MRLQPGVVPLAANASDRGRRIRRIRVSAAQYVNCGGLGTPQGSHEQVPSDTVWE